MAVRRLPDSSGCVQPWETALGDTHHFVLADPFRGLDGPVQAGLADVHILGVGIAGQQPQQRPEVDVVVIIHVTEPPEHKAGWCQGLPGCQGRGTDGAQWER